MDIVNCRGEEFCPVFFYPCHSNSSLSSSVYFLSMTFIVIPCSYSSLPISFYIAILLLPLNTAVVQSYFETGQLSLTSQFHLGPDCDHH